MGAAMVAAGGKTMRILVAALLWRGERGRAGVAVLRLCEVRGASQRGCEELGGGGNELAWVKWELFVWDTETGECVKELEGHTDRVLVVASSADGKRVFSGSIDKTVRVWDAETGECVKVLEGHTGGVFAVALSAGTSPARG